MNIAWVLFGLAACYASAVTAAGDEFDDYQGPVAEFRGAGYGGYGGYGHGGYGHGGYGYRGYRGYGGYYTPTVIPGYGVYRTDRQLFARNALKNSLFPPFIRIYGNQPVYPVYPIPGYHPGYIPGYQPGFGYHYSN